MLEMKMVRRYNKEKAACAFSTNEGGETVEDEMCIRDSLPDQLHRVSGARGRSTASGSDAAPQRLCAGRDLLSEIPRHYVVWQGGRAGGGRAQPPPVGIILILVKMA